MVEHTVCASHNFWRLCQLDKANMVVPKNRPYKVKVVGQVFFFSFPGVVILVSFFVFVYCVWIWAVQLAFSPVS